jgi:cellulose synthase/poly-beta-1,6-N-acetylglucosamine synthase-like glycosyltransferase
MWVLEIFFNIIFYTIGIFLLLNCCYLLFFAIMGHRKSKGLSVNVKVWRRMCILIPDYKEDVVIIDTVKSALSHPYNGNFEVHVIADSLQPETVRTLKSLGAGVIEVSFERSTKGKALLTALNQLPEDRYDVAVVLDVDNIMGENFLNEINKAFESGFRVVQAHRTAKNMDSAFALLDTCNEEINNHIYRKGQYAVGLSAALIGSGMAFEYAYFQKLLIGIGETVGEDKEIDFRIAKDRVKIGYLDMVYVFDEKIENSKVFTQQRTRWISAQLELLKKYTFEGIKHYAKYGNFEFLNKVFQVFLVPRMLLIGILAVFFMISWVIPFMPPPFFWGILLLMLSGSLFLSLPARLYNKQLGSAIIRLPYAVFCMFKALLRVNQTKASFMPTPHKTKNITSEIIN